MIRQFVLVLMLLTLNVYAKDASIQEILDHMDKLYRSSSSISQVKMEVTNPNWKRTLKLNMWTRGMKSTFIRILYPRRDKGIATLRKGNEMWNYFPKINKVLKVPPSMRMGSWMGSDFTNDDLVKETTLIDDYHSKFSTRKESGYYLIDLTPKENTVSVWGKIELKIRKSDLLPVHQLFYDEKGSKARIMYFKDIKKIGGRKIPNTIELIPLKKEGHKTVVTYIKVEFDTNVPKTVFTRRNLIKRK